MLQLDSPLALAILALGALLLALLVAAGTASLRKALLARDLLDHPNERSSHVQPTPRGGGLALIPLLVLAWLIAVLLAGSAPSGFWNILPATVLLAAVSWVDDTRNLPPAPRFLAQIAAVMLGLGAMGDTGPLFQGLLPLWLDLLLSAFAWLWFINLFNFMDGIDGITGTQSASIALGLSLLAWLGSWSGLDIALPCLLLAAVLGFLKYNWHPAKIFLGDVGSVPLGFLIGWLLLLAAGNGAWAAALILPAYYWADATLTLLRRGLRGEKVWQAHREHFYQRATQGGLSHDQVVRRIALLNLALIGLALLSYLWDPRVPLAGAAILVTGLLINFSLQQRPEED
ncbi:MraY family glycosyltransferase [Rhodovibrionaceae bacterium A322]